MDPENITPDTLPDGSQLNPAGVDGAVGNGTGTGTAPAQQMDALSLAEINNLLGKTYPSKDIALKSIKDTFSYVGKPREAIEKEVRASVQQDDRISKLAQELEIERKERFYDRNPQYADPSIRKIIDTIGGNPVDVVNREEFKNVFEKVSGYDKSTKLKTVLESNPRMVSSRDNLTKARDLRDSQGQVTNEVQKFALDAIKDAYNL
jgi:hypothetical protein